MNAPIFVLLHLAVAGLLAATTTRFNLQLVGANLPVCDENELAITVEKSTGFALIAGALSVQSSDNLLSCGWHSLETAILISGIMSLVLLWSSIPKITKDTCDAIDTAALGISGKCTTLVQSLRNPVSKNDSKPAKLSHLSHLLTRFVSSGFLTALMSKLSKLLERMKNDANTSETDSPVTGDPESLDSQNLSTSGAAGSSDSTDCNARPISSEAGSGPGVERVPADESSAGSAPGAGGAPLDRGPAGSAPGAGGAPSDRGPAGSAPGEGDAPSDRGPAASGPGAEPES